MSEHHVYCPSCGSHATLTANERFTDNSGRATIDCGRCRQSFGAMIVLAGLPEKGKYQFSVIGGGTPRLANAGMDPNYDKPAAVPPATIETDC
jgi:Zn finger protein HypA/HybF involved in hydrogenase expression